jgi:gliding motility-associated-like protein
MKNPLTNKNACYCSPPTGGGKSSKLLLTLFTLLLSVLSTYAQNLSNKGTEFWTAYGHHQFMEPNRDNSQQMILYLSAEQPANVTVSVDSLGWSRSYSIPANTVVPTDFIPKGGTYDARLYSVPPAFGGTGGEGVFRSKGIHIVSDVPIVAYAHIYGSTSSGATTLMPVNTWGYYYVSLNSEQNYDFDCFSWMYVVASHDSTVVEITPSALTRMGRPAGVPFQVNLNKGQIYQVIGTTNGSSGVELTGTKVRSIGNASDTCYPIAVFSGSSRTAITCTPPGGSGSGDNNMQQVFPSQAWGKRYLLAPFSVDNTPSSFMTCIYKVVVKDPTTVVKRNGVALTGLIGNSYYRFISGTADYIEADKPILVAQFMSSAGGCPNTGGNGDPEMVYLSPIEQAIKNIGFYRNNRESITVNYLTLIIPTAGMTSLKIDGQNNAWNHAYAHPNLPGYSVVVKRWPAAQAQCLVSSDSAYTAVTYGLGGAESYGYNAGTLINNLNAFGTIHNELDTSGAKNEFTCTSTPVELSVLLAYQPTKMVWQISQLGNQITPNNDVVVNAPVSSGQEIVNGVPYYKYRLPGTYKFSNTGDYNIKITNTHPSIEKCDHTEEVMITVKVKAKPSSKFTYTHTGCTKDSVYFAGDTSGNGYNVNRWKWTFPAPAGAAIDSGQKVAHAFAAGQQTVQLSVITKEGCVSDTTATITIFPRPTANFATSVQALCEGGDVTVTDQSTFAGSGVISNWYWDEGNGTVVNNNTSVAQTAHYGAYGTYNIKHVVKVSDLCVSDTISKPVTVYAKPNPVFTYPNSCLPVDGIVEFTSMSTAPDGQAIASYSWDFGDAGATPGNPNTSTAANPQHTYSTFGTYTIKYSATTVNGCTKDTTVTATFKLKPKLEYAALSEVCVNQKGTVDVAKATVTNGVTGTGTYKGPGTSAAGAFTAATAGVGTHTIWYIYNTNSGCVDSISKTIKVNPKPAAAFTANDVCLGDAVAIADQSTISAGNIASWNWSFGDGTNEVRTDNSAFNKTYTAWKTYTVKLVAVSDLGCASDSATHTVAVHALPVADYALPTHICMPEGRAEFTNATTTPDKAGLTYQWSFGDGTAISTATSPVHIYQQAGNYNIQLIATTAFGCVSTKDKVLNAFYTQPVAKFSVAPDTLCQGTESIFTDESTDASNNITTWSWTFGDGTNSGKRNPVKEYALPGEYNVQLIVTNGAGCVSSPANDKVVVYLQPQIDAGDDFIVPQGTQIQFNATANDSTQLAFRWTPPTGLSSPTLLQPWLVAMADQVYTLTATGKGSCAAMDKVTVKVLKPVKVPNAFSPNGDGINDRWVLSNLAEYPNATVEVFNRYGQRVYYSVGYNTPWDGTWKEKLLPLATYYYIIKLKNGFAPLTGYVTILQ